MGDDTRSKILARRAQFVAAALGSIAMAHGCGGSTTDDDRDNRGTGGATTGGASAGGSATGGMPTPCLTIGVGGADVCLGIVPSGGVGPTLCLSPPALGGAGGEGPTPCLSPPALGGTGGADVCLTAPALGGTGGADVCLSIP